MSAPTRCAGCTILIGPGYLHLHGWPSPDGVGTICSACHRDLERIAARGGNVAATLRTWQRDLWRSI